jgi:hypothetical protein
MVGVFKLEMVAGSQKGGAHVPACVKRASQ